MTQTDAGGARIALSEVAHALLRAASTLLSTPLDRENSLCPQECGRGLWRQRRSRQGSSPARVDASCSPEVSTRHAKACATLLLVGLIQFPAHAEFSFREVTDK